jgi:hypothetical protein
MMLCRFPNLQRLLLLGAVGVERTCCCGCSTAGTKAQDSSSSFRSLVHCTSPF